MFFIGQQAVRKSAQPIWIEVAPLPRHESTQQRVVETRLENKTKDAAKDAFLGKQTQTVDRATVNRKRDVISGQQTTQAKSQSRANSKTQAPSLSNLGVAMLPKLGENGAPASSMDSIESQDYVKGFKEGEHTALNTREYIFYGYFQRIRQRLELAWTPSLREHLIKMYKSGRQLASDMDHQTRLLVTLNDMGEIVKVTVLEASGTLDLDDAAVKAFNTAGPFPNPPKGIVDKEGKIKIRWDFVLRS
jgi:TonB family protein